MTLYLNTTGLQLLPWVLCLTQAQMDSTRKALKAEPGPLVSDSAKATAWRIEQPERAVIVVGFSQAALRLQGAELAGLLAHEAAHILQWTLEEWGENAAGDEVQAYALQALVKGMHREFCALRRQLTAVRGKR